LALATVVVEARVTSGALITVDAALAQGRTVLAVPGPITSATSEGCNKLIQQGAKPALCAGDILEELGLGGFTPGPRAGGEAPPDLSPLQLSLWNQLAERRHIDALAINAQAAPPEVMIALTELELRGLVRQEPGMNFTRV
jgi:DNA processing protein